jgi:hypothetical protein
MGKRNPFIRCLVLVTFIVCCTACAGTPVRESTGEFIDDSVITTKIKSQLAADSFLKIFQISVETYKGTVQLSVLSTHSAMSTGLKKSREVSVE